MGNVVLVTSKCGTRARTRMRKRPGACRGMPRGVVPFGGVSTFSGGTFGRTRTFSGGTRPDPTPSARRQVPPQILLRTGTCRESVSRLLSGRRLFQTAPPWPNIHLCPRPGPPRRERPCLRLHARRVGGDREDLRGPPPTRTPPVYSRGRPRGRGLTFLERGTPRPRWADSRPGIGDARSRRRGAVFSANTRVPSRDGTWPIAKQGPRVGTGYPRVPAL